MITSCYRDRNKPTFEKEYEVKVRHELDVDDEEDDDTDDGADIVIRSHGRRKKQRR